MFEVGRIVGLVGIDENQIELTWLVQLAKRLQRRRQTQVDSPGQPCLEPVTAGGGIVIAGNVATDQ
ncbi:hypothetical protein D9M71_787220 [compost metagenome]